MPTKRKKISALPLAETLNGLHTIGVDNQNKSVKVSLGFVETAATNADAAAGEATTEAEKATAAANSANDATAAADQAAANANAKASEAGDKAIEADNATLAARQTTSEARATIVRLEELEQSLVGQYKMIPTGLNLDYPSRVTRRNTVPRCIKYSLLPTDTGRNVLFLGDDNAVSVLPDGSLTINRAGISKIHVIPTENTTIFKTIQITVADPELRRVKTNSLRFMGNGNLRLT